MVFEARCYRPGVLFAAVLMKRDCLKTDVFNLANLSLFSLNMIFIVIE